MALFILQLIHLQGKNGVTVYWINVLWMLLGQAVVLYAVGVPVYYLAKRNLSALIQPEKDKKEE